jgi:NAD-dependent oxidoreductase involved in siderophore biosynthesis
MDTHRWNRLQEYAREQAKREGRRQALVLDHGPTAWNHYVFVPADQKKAMQKSRDEWVKELKQQKKQ